MRVPSNYLRSREGNITIMFAFMFLLVALFAGGAVDFTRRNAVRADLIESLDAAGLAVAQMDEAGTYTEAELKDYGRKFFHENFSHEDQIRNFNLDFNITEATITPVAQGEIKTLFLGLVGNFLGASDQFDTLSMATDTEITRKGSGPIELALVLDVTGSMSEEIGGVAKIESLRNASAALLNSLYGDADDAVNENVLSSVVPFNAFVGAGAAIDEDGNSAWTSAWGDTNALSTYHGAHFLHVNSSSVIDLNTKVNHYKLFNSLTTTDWAGCFMERPYPLDEIDTEAGSATTTAVVNSYYTPPTGTTNADALAAFSSAPAMPLSAAVVASEANSRFVPMFAPDDPDCDSSSECEWGSTSYTLNGVTYKGNWFHDPANDGYDDYENSWISDKQYTYRTPSTYFAKYLPVANSALRALRYHSGYSGTSSGCPSSGTANAALNTWLAARGATECYDDEYILRQAYVGTFNSGSQRYENKLNLSVSIDEYVNEVSGDEWTRGPNKGCTSGLLYHTTQKEKLSDFINALAPAGNTNSAEGMMWGWRVLSPAAPFTSSIPYNDGQWQKAVVLMTDGFNTVSSADTPWYTDLTPYGYGREERMGTGVNTASEMKAQLDQKLLRICTRMKAQGILVYAVTFGLSDSDPDEAATKATFQTCASDDEAPYYFDAPDGEELEAAFTDIAADLVQLHISR